MEGQLLKKFLADTWWYGFTTRWSEEQMLSLARLRKKQGFSAIQMVVGIPPEVGPQHPSAASVVGAAWNLLGKINHAYLELARRKILLLNRLGLTVIVYGAWGHQIEWLGEQKMKDWWKEVISFLTDLDVVFCLSGESDLWIGEEKLLLPDKSTKDLGRNSLLPGRIKTLLYKISSPFLKYFRKNGFEARKQKWSKILEYVSELTEKPLLLHTTQRKTSFEAVKNPERLSAITVQTGHDYSQRNALWKRPLEIRRRYPNIPYINLEPWYEGIKGQFYKEDQLYAFWVTMLSGATAYCYGAHGIWNLGDGDFLSQWGKQTFNEAKKLDTPRLIGNSYKLFYDFMGKDKITKYLIKVSPEGNLTEIGLEISKNKKIMFYPDIKSVSVSKSQNTKFWDPLTAGFVKKGCQAKKQLIVLRG